LKRWFPTSTPPVDEDVIVVEETAFTAGTVVLKHRIDGVQARRFAVVGIYSLTNRPFVVHAALLARDHELKGECHLPLFHMGPPLAIGDGQDCHLLGQVGLTNEEIEAIDDWVASISTQYSETIILPFQQYVVYPHMKWAYSEENRPLRQRFSCVGYVIEAYRSAGIELIETEQLPEVDKVLLKVAYPAFAQMERIAQKPAGAAILANKNGFQGFDDLGTPGDGPWRVALAGYLFHATDRYRNNPVRPSAFVATRIEEASFPLG